MAQPDVHVTGQFMLVRRIAYAAAGGHEAVRNAICEDTALAGSIKRSGRKIALYGGLFGMVAAWRRSLRPGIIAHTWSDVFGLVMFR